jgi:hypothetical protein
MKFGNRFKGRSDRVVAERQSRYLSHLRSQGFSPDDPVFLYFGGDVFHDGDVAIEHIGLLAGTIDVHFRNVYAADKITTALSRLGLGVPPGHDVRLDCTTLVRFSGVDRCEVAFRDFGAECQYYCSEVWVKNPGYLVDIYLYSPKNFGRISLRCGGVEVENIRPRLEPYLALGVLGDRLLYHSGE